MKYSELESRATERLSADLQAAERRDVLRHLEARATVHGIIEEMKSQGEALVLSDEEMKMLANFRRFKIRMRKNGEVFTWQTRIPEGVQIAADTAEILHPSEA